MNEGLVPGLMFAVENQLSLQDMRLMMLFFESERLSTTQITSLMRVSRMTVYNMIQRLIKKDMIELIDVDNGTNVYRMMLRHIIKDKKPKGK